MRRLREFFLGFLIGGTMSVPGVSGGTTAIALGCYGEILTAAGDLKKKENRWYLIKMLLGGVCGFFLLAGGIAAALRILPLTVTAVFCGAAGTGLYLLGREAFRTGISLNGVLFFLLGLGVVAAVERMPEMTGNTSPLLSVVWGFFLAVGIILPGISTSHLLMVFGLYDDVAAIGGWRDLLTLLPLGIGAAAGILLLTKPLAALMKRYPGYCNFALLGFGVGSLKALVAPCIGHPQIGYLLWFQIANGLILGAGAVWGILKLNQRKIDGDAPQ